MLIEKLWVGSQVQDAGLEGAEHENWNNCLWGKTVAHLKSYRKLERGNQGGDVSRHATTPSTSRSTQGKRETCSLRGQGALWEEVRLWFAPRKPSEAELLSRTRWRHPEPPSK